ncbi:MAG: porin [Desulfuromusa sp.]
MRKILGFMALVIGFCLGGSLISSQTAFAGPFVEFGDSGWMQFDVKLQGIADFTDFGSGIDGNESRSDLYLRRARISMTGMLNDTWGAKFQT